MMEQLGRLLPAPGMLSERMTLYVARELSPGTKHPDEDEFLEVLSVRFDEALEWVRSGRIVDAKTVVIPPSSMSAFSSAERLRTPT